MIDRLFTAPIVTRTATRDELRRLEREVGPLPPSYRAFAARYGSGRVNGLFFVLMPFEDRCGGFADVGAGLKRTLEDRVADWAARGDAPGDPDCLEACDDRSEGVADRWREFVFFGHSENGESFFWLRTGEEFSFFALDRAFMSIRHGGDDLIGMIAAMQTPEVKRILGSGYEPLPPIFGGDSNFTHFL